MSTTSERFKSPEHRMWRGWVELWELVWPQLARGGRDGAFAKGLGGVKERGVWQERDSPEKEAPMLLYYLNRCLEKAVAGATTLNELPSGTFVMVRHNGQGTNIGTVKAPTREKKWQSAVQGSLTTLSKKLVADYKGLERLSSKGRT